jgi:hypothetical protein
MRLENAVSLLFSWSQRADLNRGPTDYEFLLTVPSKEIKPILRDNSAIFLRTGFPISRKSAENSGHFGALLGPESDSKNLPIHHHFEREGIR